jgi:hypothetical protein
MQTLFTPPASLPAQPLRAPQENPSAFPGGGGFVPLAFRAGWAYKRGTAARRARRTADRRTVSGTLSEQQSAGPTAQMEPSSL